MRGKKFPNSFSKQKVTRAACREQLNETTRLTKASGTTCRLPVLVGGSVVDSHSHQRSCSTEEQREELPACLPGTAWCYMVAHYICQHPWFRWWAHVWNTFLFSAQQVCVLCCPPWCLKNFCWTGVKADSWYVLLITTHSVPVWSKTTFICLVFQGNLFTIWQRGMLQLMRELQARGPLKSVWRKKAKKRAVLGRLDVIMCLFHAGADGVPSQKQPRSA